MAWFTNTDQPQPVTLARIEKVFKDNDFSYDNRGDRLATSVNGFFLRVEIINDALLYFGFRFFNVPLPKETLPEIESWVQNRNLYGTIGTCGVGIDDDGDVYVDSDHVFFIVNGATDEQLSLYCQTGIEAQLEHLEDFVEKFEIERPLPEEE